MTHLRAILAIARKDALDIVLDRAKLVGLAGPIALTLLYLLVGSVISGHITTILIYNPEHSQLEQVIDSAFTSPNTTEAGSPDAVNAAFGSNGAHKKSAYDVGLIIPADFEQSLRAGAHLQVELYLNGANITTQQNILLQATIKNYARTVATPIPPASLITATINPQTSRSPFKVSKFYSIIVLPISLLVGLTLMPGLLIEEKEKKTLRMLMVSPASFADVVLGKVVVALGCQLAVSLIVRAVIGGFVGNTPLILLYTLLGGSFAVVVGLLLGSVLQTASAAGGLEIPIIFAFIIPGIFIPLAGVGYLSSNPILQIIKILPTYYFVDGVYNAIQNQGSLGGNALDIGVTVGSVLIILLLSLWGLRRQASVAATL